MSTHAPQEEGLRGISTEADHGRSVVGIADRFDPLHGGLRGAVTDEGHGIVDASADRQLQTAGFICHNNVAAPWAIHQGIAASMGASLLSILNAATNAKAFQMAQTFGQSPWIGANDLQVEGQWVWDDGSIWCYENWYGPNPDNFNNEDCAQLYQGISPAQDSMWNDGGCDSIIPALYQSSTDLTGGTINCQPFTFPAPDVCPGK